MRARMIIGKVQGELQGGDVEGQVGAPDMIVGEDIKKDIEKKEKKF
tara:strand:+ start:103 stop:240 length:138 start_codon:yes stop_codon:yes gene_type:complete